MAIRIVQSKSNPGVKELRAALRHPGRNPGEAVGLEGVHLVAEALHSRIPLSAIYIMEGREAILDDHLLAPWRLARTHEVIALPEDLFRAAVSTESPQPIAALSRPRTHTWESLLTPAPALIVVLAGLQDPGNLGTVLRSAEAFGATGAILLPGTVSPWNPKAMRASAGSVFRLAHLHASQDDCLARLAAHGIRTFAAMPDAPLPLASTNLSQPAALVIGSEGAGVPPAFAERCHARITIPTPGPVESLNAAIAASILLYEAARQRSASGSRP